MTAEPTEFGSVVLATHLGRRRLFQKAPMHGKHYWEDSTGVVDVWSELADVKVIRRGVTTEDPDGDMTAAEFDAQLAAGTPVQVKVALTRRRFCTLNRNCRMADLHEGPCQP